MTDMGQNIHIEMSHDVRSCSSLAKEEKLVKERLTLAPTPAVLYERSSQRELRSMKVRMRSRMARVLGKSFDVHIDNEANEKELTVRAQPL